MGFKQPTPIQKACIPVGLLGKDICACAATGTGTEDRDLGVGVGGDGRRRTRDGEEALGWLPKGRFAKYADTNFNATTLYILYNNFPCQ